MSEAIVTGARRLGYFAHPQGRRGPHLFGLRREGGLPPGLGRALSEAKVFVSLRGDAIRVSPKVYNDERDAARFLAVLEAAS